MVRYDIRFTGQVQGVFFRATAQEVAAGLAVTGWVRNEPDGSVRCVIEGEAAELDRFVAAVERAKRGNIAGREIRKTPATGEFASFEVRR
jgi:acylphosphatase